MPCQWEYDSRQAKVNTRPTDGWVDGWVEEWKDGEGLGMEGRMDVKWMDGRRKAEVGGLKKGGTDGRRMDRWKKSVFLNQKYGATLGGWRE